MSDRRETFDEWRERMRAAGGDAWDKIPDPDAFIREMRGDPAWRREPPDRIGWWWVQPEGEEPFVVKVYTHDDRLRVNAIGLDVWLALLADARFARCEPPEET